MKLALVKASTNQTIYIFIQDSSSTIGAGLTGLLFDAGSLVCYFVRPLAAAVQLTLVTQTVTGAHTDGGFIEVSSSNMPGIYRLDLSDAILATGVNSVVVMLKGAANMAPLTLEIQLTTFDLNSANPDVNVKQISGDAVAADNLESDYDGTGFNKSNSTIGTTTTNTDMRGTNLAALASVNTEARLSELDAATGGKAANQIDLIKTEADKIALVDAGAGVAGSVIEEVENRATPAQVNTEVDNALNTIIPGSPTAGSVNDVLKDVDAKLPTNNFMGSGVKTDKDDEIDSIKTETDKIGTPAGPSLSADLASNNTAITGISNVTRLNQALPTYHVRPASGDVAVRWDFALHDTNGNQEDPDGNQLAIKITNSAGTVLSSRLFKENALTTALDAGTGTFTGFVKLEKTATGRYFAFIKVNSADTEEELRLELGWEEGSVALFQFGATQILDVTNDLIDIKNDTAAILGDTAEMQGKLPTNNIMGSSVKTDKDDEIDSIKVATDQLAFTAGNVNSHTKVQDDLALTSQQKLDVNAEVDSALNTAIPGSPIADSVNERIKALDDLLQSGGLGDAAAVLVDTGTSIPALIAALNDLSAAQINTEVLDVMNVDTLPELAQAIPPATPTHFQATMLFYMALRNKLTIDASNKKIFNDAGTNIATKALSDVAGVLTEAEMIAGT